jgi:lysophospholipase L1-like esterase
MSSASILLYGDSLVFGKVPGENRRYDESERIGGYLRGRGHVVVEEGLRARTLSGENSFFEDRNGLAQFGHIIGSHLPVDVLVIMLGTNDCNSTSVSYESTESVLGEYLAKVTAWSEFLNVSKPRVYVCIPPAISEQYMDAGQSSIFGSNPSLKRTKLTEGISHFCVKEGVKTVDLSVIVPEAGDGIHLTPAQNKQVAELILHTIRL